MAAAKHRSQLCRAFGGALLAAAACQLAGCAAMPPRAGIDKRAQPPQAPPEEIVVEQFEQHRTEAELTAARTRAEHGDLSGCHEIVEAVLRREPHNADALLMMADVQLARENPAAAERFLNRLVANDPDNAAGHFAFGLLLESSGRADKAEFHFALAAELEPENSLYALGAAAAE